MPRYEVRLKEGWDSGKIRLSGSMIIDQINALRYDFAAEQRSLSFVEKGTSPDISPTTTLKVRDTLR